MRRPAYALPAEPPVATGTIAFDEGTGWSVRVRYSYSFVRAERRVKAAQRRSQSTQWLDGTALALVATYKPDLSFAVDSAMLRVA